MVRARLGSLVAQEVDGRRSILMLGREYLRRLAIPGLLPWLSCAAYE